MEKTLKGYLNCVILGAKEKIVFTVSEPQESAQSSKAIEYILPEGWALHKTIYGRVYVTTSWGKNYDPNSLLTTQRGKKSPCFRFFRDGQYRVIKLEYRISNL